MRIVKLNSFLWFFIFCSVISLCIPLRSDAGSVNLSWHPNAELDLQGYNVYYGTQSRSYGPPVPVGDANQHEIQGLEKGETYYFAVSAIDNAGNESGYSSETSKQIPFNDDTAPSIIILSPVEGDTYTSVDSNVTLSGSATDDHDLQQITWQSSSGTSGTTSGTDAWTTEAIALVEGSNVITVTATDSAGNEGQDTITIAYTAPDPLVPITNVSTSADDGNVGANTIDDSLDTRWSAEGDGQWIQYDLGQTFSVSRILIAFFHGDERTADFEIQASSDAANWQSLLRETSSGTTLQQEGYALPNTVARYVRIVGYGNSLNAWNSITEVGIRGVAYSAPDTTPPAVTISSPTVNGSYETAEPTIQLAGTTADDSQISEVRWSSSSGVGGTASGTTNWTIPDITLQEGSNTITVTAKDAAGNQGSATLTVVYTIPDNLAPVISITSPTANESFTAANNQIDLSGSAEDTGGIEKITWTSSIGGNGIASGTTSWTVSGIELAEGITKITVKATDSAGNTAYDTLTVSYSTGDTTAPTVQITSPTTKNSYFSRTSIVDIEGAATDNVGIERVEWQNSRGESGSCIGTDKWKVSGIALDRWWNTITITAYDSTGNAAYQELKVFRWR